MRENDEKPVLRPMGSWRILTGLTALFVFAFACNLSYPQGPGERGGRWANRGPQVGDTIADIRLKTHDGQPVDLKTLLKDHPVVLETGSYTCPVFRSKVNDMEKLYQKFKDRATFLIIYTPEAHPRDTPSYFSKRMMYSRLPSDKDLDQPRTYEKRVWAARSCITNLGISIPVLVDEMNNDVTDYLGPAPNAAYLIGKDGKINARYGWLDVKQLEKDLETMVGR